MNDDDQNLSEERLRLEREALAVERERLAAARAHAEAEANLFQKRHRPVLAFVSVTLLVLLAATGGFLGGIAVMENRQQRERAERLAQALSKIEGWTDSESGTNAVHRALPPVKGKAPANVHGGVSVVVIQ